MSVLEILDTLVLKPLQLIFEVVYIITNRITGNPGMSIVILSLLMNFLVLPLYMRADAMQEEERETEKRLEKGVSHIKKTFRGDERMMMLQTYYRQNDYKPTYVLKGAVSLFLEIPFFIAAYRFLSTLQLLNGVSFGPVADLGRPDGMLSFAGVTVNVLPIIMTAVNLVSCVIFTKGSTLKSKIQLYAMALFFLVFLYSSPSGLVFYWTLNNVFSLVKTCFYKMKNPRGVLAVMAALAGIGVLVYGLFFCAGATGKMKAFFALCALLMQIPILGKILRGGILSKKFGKFFAGTGGNNADKGRIKAACDKKIFAAGGVFLAVLLGALIPSAVIASSPQEFVDITYYYNPLWFVVSSFCLAFGIFVIWLGVFYHLVGPSAKFIFDKAIWILSGAAVINYMFFAKDMGILNSKLKFDNGVDFTKETQLLNGFVLLAVAAVFYFIFKFGHKHVRQILATGIIAIAVMSAVNIVNIQTSIAGVKEQALEYGAETPRFSLSKDGKNVIVLMLDRAMGQYVPYIFDEKPELKEQFSGFTHYANTISFGGSTNFGAPALFGGYEYTPVEMNKRSDEPLVSKHNEALKVMPVLFDENDYDVTVCDPSYANYKWIPDLSIYDDYPDIQTYITKGKFTTVSSKLQDIKDNKRNFFCYGIMKAVPLCLQEVMYNEGMYNKEVYVQADYTGDDMLTYSEQTIYDEHTAVGMNSEFMQSYNVIEALPYITDVSKNQTNTFLMMANDMTHQTMMLQKPDYIPKNNIDNTEYDTNVNGGLKIETDMQIRHYHSNMAAMVQLGKWFDYMRKNGVYDNTRIILVSDHGFPLHQIEDLQYDDGEDMALFYPLLMVKDFNSEGFTTSDEFMTNGDVATLAMKGIIDNPVNPFTGKVINSAEKTAHDQYIVTQAEWDVNINNGNTYQPAKWYSVHDNIWDMKNWRIAAENAVLPFEN